MMYDENYDVNYQYLMIQGLYWKCQKRKRDYELDNLVCATTKDIIMELYKTDYLDQSDFYGNEFKATKKGLVDGHRLTAKWYDKIGLFLIEFERI